MAEHREENADEKQEKEDDKLFYVNYTPFTFMKSSNPPNVIVFNFNRIILEIPKNTFKKIDTRDDKYMNEYQLVVSFPEESVSKLARVFETRGLTKDYISPVIHEIGKKEDEYIQFHAFYIEFEFQKLFSNPNFRNFEIQFDVVKYRKFGSNLNLSTFKTKLFDIHYDFNDYKSQSSLFGHIEFDKTNFGNSITSEELTYNSRNNDNSIELSYKTGTGNFQFDKKTNEDPNDKNFYYLIHDALNLEGELNDTEYALLEVYRVKIKEEENDRIKSIEEKQRIADKEKQRIADKAKRNTPSPVDMAEFNMMMGYNMMLGNNPMGNMMRGGKTTMITLRMTKSIVTFNESTSQMQIERTAISLKKAEGGNEDLFKSLAETFKGIGELCEFIAKSEPNEEVLKSIDVFLGSGLVILAISMPAIGLGIAAFLGLVFKIMSWRNANEELVSFLMDSSLLMTEILTNKYYIDNSENNKVKSLINRHIFNINSILTAVEAEQRRAILSKKVFTPETYLQQLTTEFTFLNSGISIILENRISTISKRLNGDNIEDKSLVSKSAVSKSDSSSEYLDKGIQNVINTQQGFETNAVEASIIANNNPTLKELTKAVGKITVDTSVISEVASNKNISDTKSPVNQIKISISQIVQSTRLYKIPDTFDSQQIIESLTNDLTNKMNIVNGKKTTKGWYKEGYLKGLDFVLNQIFSTGKRNAITNINAVTDADLKNFISNSLKSINGLQENTNTREINVNGFFDGFNQMLKLLKPIAKADEKITGYIKVFEEFAKKVNQNDIALGGSKGGKTRKNKKNRTKKYLNKKNKNKTRKRGKRQIPKKTRNLY